MQSRFVPFVVLAGLAAACRSGAASPPPAPAAAQVKIAAQTPSGSRADRLAALQKEREDALHAYFDALQAALGDKEKPTAEEVQQARAAVHEPDLKVYDERAQQLLDEDATDLTAFETIRWMLDNTQDPATRQTFLGLLERHHIERPEMADLCDQLARGDGGRLLAKLLESSPHVEVRGRACFAKAEALQSDVQMAEYMASRSPESRKALEEYLGAEKCAALQTLDAGKAEKEIESICERVVREFGDVVLDAGSKRETTLGKRAGAALYEIRHLAVGMQSPEIEGTDLDRAALKLSDYRGKVVLISFWGSWCAPCRALLPHERSLVEKYAHEPFAIVGVNSDADLDALQDFRARENLSWRSFWNGPEGKTGPISRAWNVRSWPTLYILDAKGVIRYKAVGGNEPAIDRTLETLLAELKQPAALTK